MKNRWALTQEIEDKFLPQVMDLIEQINTNTEQGEFAEIDLSDTELNPYMLWKMLENLGYENEDIDTNGWQIDFWMNFTHEVLPPLTLSGCAITFELKLQELN